MKKSTLLGYSILTGLLLVVAWPVFWFALLLFVAWVPLLIIANNVTKKLTFFGYTFLSVLIWNIGTTYWMWNSTDVGSVAAFIVNSLLMCVPWLFYFSASAKNKNIGYFTLIVSWLTFEYIHLNWQISWPWLTLGNGFAMHTRMIQWYEYTGVAGGSVWILLMNILVHKLVVAKKEKQFIKKNMVQIVACFVVPFVCSNLIFSYQKTINSAETSSPKSAQSVLIVQPNIDPYQKFELSSASSQIATLVTATESNIDSSTTLVLWPETAMSVADWQDNISTNPYYQPIFELSKRHPKLTILSGIETFKKYGATKETPTAKKSSDGSFYYDAFNAAVYINKGTPLAFYNKSKLVPGVESLPTYLNFLGPVLEQFGGSTGGYGKSEEAEVFTNNGCQYMSAPIICYESIYGAYVGTYKQKGANLLAIITNDGWWGNTSGHKQHLQYAALRAIETRTWVARSANTGISAVIDPLGNIVAQKGWGERAVIKYRIPTKSSITFYSKYGDWLYQIFSFFAILLILRGLYNRFKKNQ